jgi:hypothetical protein
MVSHILSALGVFFACGLVWLAWELSRAPSEEELWPTIHLSGKLFKRMAGIEMVQGRSFEAGDAKCLTGLDNSERCIISLVPRPSPIARMTLARLTCFCLALRSPTIDSSRSRSSGVTVMLIPALMRAAWTASRLQGIL